jgi:hypothetical protein
LLVLLCWYITTCSQRNMKYTLKCHYAKKYRSRVLQSSVCYSLKCTWGQGGHKALLELTFLGRNRRRIRKTHTCPPNTQHDRRWNWTSACIVRTQPPTCCLWHSLQSKKGKVQGGAEVYSTLSLTSAMGMGCQRHDPAALPPEKRHGTQCKRGPKSVLENLPPPPVLDLGQPSPKQVAKPTESTHTTQQSQPH